MLSWSGLLGIVCGPIFHRAVSGNGVHGGTKAKPLVVLPHLAGGFAV
jgi:hypothetical protein